MNQAENFRETIARDGIVMVPGAPDSITARLAERAGFQAVYMTGFGATASRLGTPDIGLLTQTEMTEHARNMVRAVTIPVIADADTGYGGPSNIQRTVQEYLQAGVAAIHLEDQVAPKRCGQLAGIELMSAVASEARLRCAVEARGDSDLIVIGRTDAIASAGEDEAVSRAQRYLDAGVDFVFVDGIKTIAEVEAVAHRVEGPKVVSIVDGNETQNLSVDDIQGMGFSVVLYAVTALFTATRAVADAFDHLKSNGTPGGIKNQHSYAEYCELVDLPSHQSLDERFGS